MQTSVLTIKASRWNNEQAAVAAAAAALATGFGSGCIVNHVHHCRLSPGGMSNSLDALWTVHIITDRVPVGCRTHQQIQQWSRLRRSSAYSVIIGPTANPGCKYVVCKHVGIAVSKQCSVNSLVSIRILQMATAIQYQPFPMCHAGITVKNYLGEPKYWNSLSSGTPVKPEPIQT